MHQRLQGTHADDFAAAKRLLAQVTEAFTGELKTSFQRTVQGRGMEGSAKAGRIGKMRALCLSAPDGEGAHAAEVLAPNTPPATRSELFCPFQPSIDSP